jgi:hypothetical protein
MKSPAQQNSQYLLPSRRVVLVTSALATVASLAIALSTPASLTVDGQRVLSDVPPVTQAHEAFVPLRAVAAALGADTNFDPRTGNVELIRGEDVLRMRVGDTHATLRGKRVVLSHAPFEVRGRTMVALGFIARAFGSKVRYDGMNAHIDVISAGAPDAGAQQTEP